MAAMRPAAEKVAGAAVLLLLRGVRRLDRVKVSNFAARLMRNVGPLLPEHRIGRANLRAAYSEKSDAEIEAILRGVWDNLGRVTVEFAHIDRLAEGDPWHRTFIDYDAGSIERFLGLRPTRWPGGCRFHPRCPVAMPRCLTERPGLDEVGPASALPAGSRREPA